MALDSGFDDIIFMAGWIRVRCTMQGVVASIPITLSGIPGGIINIPIDQDGQGDNSIKDIQRGLNQDRLCFSRLDIVTVSLSC